MLRHFFAKNAIRFAPLLLLSKPDPLRWSPAWVRARTWRLHLFWHYSPKRTALPDLNKLLTIVQIGQGHFFCCFCASRRVQVSAPPARVSFRQCSLSAHADWVTGTQARNFCSVLIKIIPTAKPSAAGTTHPSP